MNLKMNVKKEKQVQEITGEVKWGMEVQNYDYLRVILNADGEQRERSALCKV